MKKIGLLFVLIFLISCSREDYVKSVNGESVIVVEGWIEQGDVSQVILSRSIPINATIDSTTIFDYFIRSAKVTVSDGENEEILSLKSENDRIPPYVYSGSKIIGEVGKNYVLKIQYLNRTIEAATSIPPVVSIKSAEYIKKSPTDTTGFIYLKFDDPVVGKNYYQIQTRVDHVEPVFVPALYGNLNDDSFVSSSVSLQVTRGIYVLSKTKYKPYFTDGDLIYVKLRTMSKFGFDFWNSWQNEIINGRSPIFPANTSLKSNIKGGLGIWEGYGQSTFSIQTIKK
ncbi:DUF4249 domain-containing protein [Flavobacterium taihuense]|uniref:DUF4249 domain-containing protein n=1 Tax=Flavobacterium taihuense TaxID=2857508 RepID=A0ABS6XTN5_9FLAO|nr:DUF4249 domain-containing protein [Flavobacterium taihuense]MBW4359611.1 DUF4249 domain-containing protein [Flavobacterium taihuense]